MMKGSLKHLLFDNDGTIVDSEIIAQKAMLRLLAKHGFHMSEPEYSRRFPGLLDRDILRLLQDEHAFQAPADFTAQLRQEHMEGFSRHLRAIPGMWGLFRKVKLPKSMVSNGSVHHVERCLRKVRLYSALDGQIFSAEHVAQPKPFPDVYLYALDRIGVKPGNALVVEDSPTGVQAAKAAGIFTIGFLGAAHIHHGHDEKLREAGADVLARDARELGMILQQMGAL